MKKKALLKKLLLLLLICSNIGCDQISKSIVRKELSSQDQIKLLYDRLTLLKVENYGAFLSFGDTLPESVRFIGLSLLPLIILGYAVYYLLTKPHPGKVYPIGLCFVIGGGIGNLYDRLLYGSVTDFLHLNLGFFQTGVFNLADVSIMIGIIMLFSRIYKNKNRPQRLNTAS